MLVLRLGFIPFADSEALRAEVDAFADALGEAMGDRMVPLLAPDYKSLLTALEKNIAQLAWVPPVVAARAVRGGHVLPAAVAVRGGASAYASALFAKADAPIAGPKDLDAARVAWVDKDSAAGYLVARAGLRGADVDLARAFRAEMFLGSHKAVARAVLEGEVDVGATYLTRGEGGTIVRAGYRELQGADDARFKIVFEAGPIPADFFGVHETLAGARLEALQRALVDAPGDRVSTLAAKLFQTDGFARPSDEHAAALAALLDLVAPLTA
ncbi:MAG TPA: PhnD/SsuA/transferrin family substrate-binding protein [Minicystis sp.]|nr:PhnD/SsuA/transferrin family substrate-binding protein [Minicystis sp.]